MTLAENEKWIDALRDKFLEKNPQWLVFAVQHDPALKDYIKTNEAGDPVIDWNDKEQRVTLGPEHIDKETLKGVVKTYPGLKALVAHLKAHELLNNGDVEKASELAEAAHTLTGIDIHPKTTLSPLTMIDHCTGSVIGADVEMGKDAMMYAGVVLGNYNGEHDERGKRHPVIGDHAVLSTGVHVFGPCHIGNNVSIGPDAHIISTHIGNNVSIDAGVTLDHFEAGIPDNTYVSRRGQDIVLSPKTDKNNEKAVEAVNGFKANTPFQWDGTILSAQQQARGPVAG